MEHVLGYVALAAGLIIGLGDFGGVDGDMLAFDYFMLQSSRKS